MAKYHMPVKGSRAFWPRKRAKRIYPRVKKAGIVKEKIIPMAFAGYKAGMTQVSYTDVRKGSATHDREVVKAVTVLDCPPMVICGVKAYTKDVNGALVNHATVWNESLGKDLGRKLKLPKKPHMKQELVGKDMEKIAEVRLVVNTQPKGSGVGKKKPELFEVPISGDVEKQWAYALEKLGKELSAEEIFSNGEFIDVRAVSKGKGFAGVVKRFGVKIRGRKHGGKRRHVGVIGPRTPARVLPGAIAMAGQLGFQTRTEYNKRILKIGNDGVRPDGGFVNYGVVPKNYILIEGSVPGPKKRLIMLRKALRHAAAPEPIEIKHVSMDSQQG